MATTAVASLAVSYSIKAYERPLALYPLHAQEPPGHSRRAVANLESGAAQRTKKRCAGRILTDGQPKTAHSAIDAGFGVVTDAGHPAAVEIERGQRLQHVIQLAAREVNRDRLIAAHAAEMFEVPDAALVEDDAADRQ